jgi:Endoribonuclease L-PSP
VKRTFVEPSERQKARAYSPAVITEGGRIVWLAGQTAVADADGKDISGDFEAQTRRVFALIDETMRRAGGTLADLVTMGLHQGAAVRRSLRRDPEGVLPQRQVPGQRAHHGLELRAAGHGD